MTQIDLTPSTVKLIYDLYANKKGEWRRPRLGASRIGHPCDRALWFEFRWSSPPTFDGRMLRLFDTGHREEARIIQELKDVGIEVYDLDPETKRQVQFEALGGHFGGSVDGIAKGFPEAPNTWHVVEIKTSNKRQFDILKKSNVQDVKPQHWAQMQCYMNGLGLDRAIYIAVCKDDDSIFLERVYHDALASHLLMQRAERIIFGTLTGLPRDENECKFCQHAEVCAGRMAPMESCRTCAHSHPLPEGGWHCDHHHRTLTHSEMTWGCEYYRMYGEYGD